jgi:hypothetical protein
LLRLTIACETAGQQGCRKIVKTNQIRIKKKGGVSNRCPAKNRDAGNLMFKGDKLSGR